MRPEIYLPTLHWFAMKNPFSGSCGGLRFMVKPNVVMLNAKEVDFMASFIHAELWHGLFCYEKSQTEKSADFPMTEEGRLALKAWLEDNV